MDRGGEDSIKVDFLHICYWMLFVYPQFGGTGEKGERECVFGWVV